MNVGYVFDPYMTKHDNPYESHPESPDRILSIYKEMLNRKLIQKMINVRSREVTLDELLLAHDKGYIEKLYKLFTTHKTSKALHTYLQTYDSVYANVHTLKCAELAAGSTVNLVTAMLNNEIERGVAIVRPPGHHGCKHVANGFCFFNNVAIAALVARNSGKTVAVVDFDIHHGQGTEQIFYGQQNLHYISIHRYDHGKFFPGTGHISSEPNILNIPLNNSIGSDSVYIDKFTNVVIPRLNEIKPDIIIVSAGFDAGVDDPLGGYNVTPKGYRTIVEMMLIVCSKLCLVLEGGYNLDTISRSMAECTEALFIN